jgi:L-lactate utilization protein LutC
MFNNDNQSHGIIDSVKSFFGVAKLHDDVVTDTLTELMPDPSQIPLSEYTSTSAYKPMATRTVDYSHVGAEPAKEETQHIERAEVAIGEMLHLDHADLDIDFATNFTAKGGKFIYCETQHEVVDLLRELSKENGWSHIFSWENELKDIFQDHDFQRGAIGYTLENSDAAICLCESLIADSGNVILNPKQASRRRLPVFPNAQILIADLSKLTTELNKALDLFSMDNKGEVPSVLDLHDNVKGCYYHDGNLVLKAEGTTNLYLILLDERIKPSTRP